MEVTTKVVTLLLILASHSCAAQQTDWYIPEARADSSEYHRYLTHTLDLRKKENRQLRQVSRTGAPKLKQPLSLLLLQSFHDTITAYKDDSSTITLAEADSLSKLVDNSILRIEEHRVFYKDKGRMVVRILTLVFVDKYGKPLARFNYPQIREFFKGFVVRHPLYGGAMMSLDEYFENRYFKVEPSAN